MSSRFDLVPQGQRFVEQYVPLPLDLILKSGAMKQAEQDKAQSEKLDFLGRQVNALEPDKPLVRKYKQDLDQELSTKWADKDFTDPSVRSAWAKRKRELANEYGPQGKIGAIEANYNAYKEYEKHIIDKAKDLGWSENYLRQHLNDVKNKFQGTIDPDNSNYYRSIQTPGLAKYVNTTEWFDKAIKNIAADTDAFGLSKELSPNEIVDIWKSGKVEYKDYNKIVNALATLAKGDVDLINSLRQEGDFSGVQGNENFISGYDEKGNILLNPNSSFSKTLSGGAYGAKYRKEDIDRMQIEDKFKLYKKKSEFDDIKTASSMIGQVVPGSSEYNLTNEIPEQLSGRIKTDSQGNVSVLWKPSGNEYLFKDKNGNTIGRANEDNYQEQIRRIEKNFPGFKVEVKTRSEFTEKERKDLYSFIKNASEAIGYEKPITSDNYNEILTNYNKAIKALTYDYKLTGAERDILIDDINSDKNNYVFKDENNIIITDPKEIAKISKKNQLAPNTRTYGTDSKDRISLTYVDPDTGEIKKVLAENLAFEDTSFHGIVGSIQKNALEYLKNGNSFDSQNNENITKEDAQAYFHIKNNFDLDGMDLVSVKVSPTKNSTYVVLGNPKNRKDLIYQELSLNKDGYTRKDIKNMPGLIKSVNLDWYNTSEGKAEALRIASSKNKYESTQKED